ncbi:MAG TPA: hypothetical protein DCX53_09800 [Anaerolineae bacterium]|nr:hypothetical protein [Anaerolineae bacterium]
MPQNGIHAMVGIASRKWMPKREWLLLGVVLGNIFPDLDNLVVAYATLANLPNPEHFHRTFTHSIFTVLAVVVLFFLVSLLARNEKWKNFGVGFGAGILMHILVDLILWFNGVVLFWPIQYELNLWGWFTEPAWLEMILGTGEFLMFGFYFLLLGSLARRSNTDLDRQRSSRIWAYIQFGLFLLFTALFFTIGAQGLLYQVFGGLYLLSLIVATVMTVQMRRTVESL